MIPGLEGIDKLILIDGDIDGFDAKEVFSACRARGLDDEQLVFTQTDIIHPGLTYPSWEKAKTKDGSSRLEYETTLESAVREIVQIHRSGIYTHPFQDVEIQEIDGQDPQLPDAIETMLRLKAIPCLEHPAWPGDMPPLVHKGEIIRMIEDHGGSINDYISGNIGYGSVDGVLGEIRSAVIVAFHLNRLEEFDGFMFRIRQPRQDAVAAIIGLYLSKLPIEPGIVPPGIIIDQPQTLE